MTKPTSPYELSVSINQNGIKTSLSIEIYPEALLLSAEHGLDLSLTDGTFADLLEAATHPTLKAVSQQLLEVNQLVSGNLHRAYVESLNNKRD